MTLTPVATTPLRQSAQPIQLDTSTAAQPKHMPTADTLRPRPSNINDEAAELERQDLPFGALFPDDNTSPANASAVSPIYTSVTSIQAVECYYSMDERKYHGTDSESLYRHVAAFRALRTRVGVHPHDRTMCKPASLGLS